MIKVMRYGEISNEEIFSREMIQNQVEKPVAEIIQNVRSRGDAALREYSSPNGD